VFLILGQKRLDCACVYFIRTRYRSIERPRNTNETNDPVRIVRGYVRQILAYNTASQTSQSIQRTQQRDTQIILEVNLFLIRINEPSLFLSPMHSGGLYRLGYILRYPCNRADSAAPARDRLFILRAINRKSLNIKLYPYKVRVLEYTPSAISTPPTCTGA
jgi:hypothetical protein